jgi:D-alanyl-D-alanine carboxypeptidase/D-alanyl-D-alanine-endopeptidase (penicillin-binding protein 4)
MALLCVALLCAVTIGAGTAVAQLLPPRLALWRIPRVTGRVFAAPGPVLRSASSAAPGSDGAVLGHGATPAGLSAAVSPLLSSLALGRRVGLDVIDLGTGQALYSRATGSAFAPASTAKLAVAVAALHVLGPGARIATRVVAGPAASSVILVGGGDPTLAAARPPASDYPQPATLQSLAAVTAAALRARGQDAIRLGYDTSLFTGPAFASGWSPSYVTSGNVTAITSVEVDQGRLTRTGMPQDADDPANNEPRSTAPAANAAAAFARFLTAAGIRVLGPATQAHAAAGSATLASVSSPPVAEIVQWMLTESNNVIAEDLARQVAIATGHPASFSGAAAAELAVLRGLGVTSGVQLVDGSGLSPRDRLTPAAEVQLLGLAAAQPRLRAVITGLPVAGFSGTLAPGGSVFGEMGRGALGVVRAKTGNLNTVAALAGIAYARDGQLLGFAMMADRLSASQLDAAGADMARLATILAGCGCR